MSEDQRPSRIRAFAERMLFEENIPHQEIELFFDEEIARRLEATRIEIEWEERKAVHELLYGGGSTKPEGVVYGRWQPATKITKEDLIALWNSLPKH